MLHASSPLALLPPWADARDTLLSSASRALDRRQVPEAMLLAFVADEPVASVLLRPFGAGELTDVLVETLALLLPMGADRIALAVPGRAWSTQDPIPPVTPDADLRTPVVVVSIADGHGDGDGCTVETSIHAYAIDELGWSWSDEVAVEGDLDAPAAAALRILVGSHEELTPRTDLHVAAQFARVLLLGHHVVLAPVAAARLEVATRAS